MAEITVRVESVHSDDARQLIAALSRELAEIYQDPEEGKGAFDPDAIEAYGVDFFVARCERQAIGCGALRSFDEIGAGEVKRLFVVRKFRGQGIGRRLMVEIEAVATERGYRKLVLETGTLQPKAMALYEKLGFMRRACWGKYIDNPWSVCYEKTLYHEL